MPIFLPTGTPIGKNVRPLLNAKLTTGPHCGQNKEG